MRQQTGMLFKFRHVKIMTEPEYFMNATDGFDFKGTYKTSNFF